MFKFVVWGLSKLGKNSLLRLLKKIAQAAFGKLYNRVENAVRAAELKYPDGTGAEKMAWVIQQIYNELNTLKEVKRWVLNILIEIAVGEVKDYTYLPTKLGKYTGVK